MFNYIVSSCLIAGAFATSRSSITQTSVSPSPEVAMPSPSPPAEFVEFVLPKLPYAYNALKPYIDRRTMVTHHSKHHQAYIDKLNAAVITAGGVLDAYSLTDLVVAVGTGEIPADVETAVRNQGGGHWNHSFFWKIMAPVDESQEPRYGSAKATITAQFGSVDAFKEQFAAAAAGVFGSGWAWLCVSSIDASLVITTTPNQDNPLMTITSDALIPIMGIDVWEHAYYLKYKNVRADYIAAFLNVLNWEQIEDNYTLAAQGLIPDPLEH